jgi:hypothetical protein
MRLIPVIAVLALALGAVEGLAYWWMNPAPAGLGQPVLVYRPGSAKELSVVSGQLSEKSPPPAPELTTVNSPTSSSSSTANRQPTTDNSPSSSSTITPLPEVYAKAAPMLRCSTGQVLHVTLEDSAGVHLAFFEWDGTDTGSVLEAFRHMPEACMGSIGMKLISHEKVIPYQVGSETLLFDHTVFSEDGRVSIPGSPIHAFRAVWVSGVAAADARQGIDGEDFDRLRTIRLESALHRFRPAQARVIQGAVRGIADPKLAWLAFEDAMLKDLKFVTR